MSWIMSSQKVKGNEAGIHFFIGAVRVAKAVFVQGQTAQACVLIMDGLDTEGCDSISSAMRKMHRALNSASPLDASVNSQDRGV